MATTGLKKNSNSWDVYFRIKKSMLKLISFRFYKTGKSWKDNICLYSLRPLMPHCRRYWKDDITWSQGIVDIKMSLFLLPYMNIHNFNIETLISLMGAGYLVAKKARGKVDVHKTCSLAFHNKPAWYRNILIQSYFPKSLQKTICLWSEWFAVMLVCDQYKKVVLIWSDIA